MYIIGKSALLAKSFNRMNSCLQILGFVHLMRISVVELNGRSPPPAISTTTDLVSPDPFHLLIRQIGWKMETGTGHTAREFRSLISRSNPDSDHVITHSTMCDSGTAVGARYGVAKNANVYAVKVLSDKGSGMTSDM